ncbi:MAG: haloacid dehalogenase type II [Solirubrobacterales bacterium]
MAPTRALFDLNGTLFDPSPMAEPLPREADGARFVQDVLDDAVLLAAVETITGSFRDFAELLRAAAARHLSAFGEPEMLDAVMEASKRMPPFPEASVAIEALRSAGVQVGILTNSSRDAACSLLSRAGLELEPVVGTDDVGAFKPDRRVYERGVEATNARPSDVVLVTAHWWDALGAKRAGLRAAWISRNEAVRVKVEPSPDYEAGDLAEIAGQIAAR